jgi:ankyrin repeat protein
MAPQDIGATPLYMASIMGHVECIHALLDRGADINKATVRATRLVEPVTHALAAHSGALHCSDAAYACVCECVCVAPTA